MRLQHRSQELQLLVGMLLIGLLSGCSAKKAPVSPSVAHAPAPSLLPTTSEPQWTEVSSPFPAADITAVGKVFWVCGAEEMVASSSDGGNSWQLKHHTPGKFCCISPS